MLNFRSI